MSDVCKVCGNPLEVVGRYSHGRYQGDLVRCGCCAPMPSRADELDDLEAVDWDDEVVLSGRDYDSGDRDYVTRTVQDAARFERDRAERLDPPDEP